MAADERFNLVFTSWIRGQGPEHSSARFERYLQLCAENNMYVVNATTPANISRVATPNENQFRIPSDDVTQELVASPKSSI